MDGWSHPPKCSNYDSSAKSCTYNATWEYIPSSDSVRFVIETHKADQWTGIGFSEDTRMRNSDAVIGWATATGQFFISDTFMNSYTAPKLDRQQVWKID